jgi:hypothetical protein
MRFDSLREIEASLPVEAIYRDMTPATAIIFARTAEAARPPIIDSTTISLFTNYCRPLKRDIANAARLKC